ncbi:MAG: FlgD immunoglobulin-like domain containing protein, partial [Bacteroidota bacterium]
AVRAASDEAVSAEVFDVMGRRVATLEAGTSAGAVVELGWTGADASGRALAGGVYVVQVRQGAERQVVKLTLLR